MDNIEKPKTDSEEEIKTEDEPKIIIHENYFKFIINDDEPVYFYNYDCSS